MVENVLKQEGLNCKKKKWCVNLDLLPFNENRMKLLIKTQLSI